MSVETVNPAYTENIPLWSLVEDVVNGQTAVKNRGEDYLPRPSGMDQEAFSGYLKRATFAMFTARACEQLYGQIFSKFPEKQGGIPQAFQDFLDDAGDSGRSAIIKVKLPVEYIRQGTGDPFEVYFEGGLKKVGNIWIPVKKPQSTFYDRRIVKNYLKNKK